MTDDFLAEDALDRRAALTFAGEAYRADPYRAERIWQRLADQAYRWLRWRDSLRAVTIKIVPGQPRQEGTEPVTTTFNLADTDEVPFTLVGLDAKLADAPLPAGFTAAWTLADPDSSGAVLTVSDDTTTATLSAGVPDTNLMVSVAVTVTNPDGSTTTLPGAEAVVVTATAATTVGLVPGTPAAEAPPAG